MEFSQIQALIEQCQSVLQFIGTKSLWKVEGEDQLSPYKRLVRKKKQEIESIRQINKADKVHVIRQKEWTKQINNLERQIKNTRSICHIQEEQSEKLAQLCNQTYQKIEVLHKKMAEISNEEERIIEKQKDAQKNAVLQYEYWEKRRKIQLLHMQKGQHMQKYYAFIQQKVQLTNQLATNIEVIDTKLNQLSNKIQIQKEVIQQISNRQINSQKEQSYQENQQQSTKAINLLGDSESNQFAKKEELDLWEIHMIENVIINKIDQIDKEKKKIGYVLNNKQRMQLNYGKIIRNRNFNNTNLEHDKFKRRSLPIILNNSQCAKISSEVRLKQLEKKRRIRTKSFYNQQLIESPKLKPETQLTNIVNEEGIENQSILTIYEKLNRNNKIFTNSNSNNIEIIKIIKRHNKKKLNLGKRSIPFERQDNQ